jgi:hypothetical protein
MARQDDRWRKASYSNGSDECVEISHRFEMIAVRDTKNPSGTVLTIPADSWHRFTSSLK